MEQRHHSDRIPIWILTGFLGSGKTTLLNRLLKEPGFARTLVIVNELGEIGIDGALIRTVDEDLVVEMAGGCLCCSLQGDLGTFLRRSQLASALRDSDDNVPFDQVVIETTGATDPAPIMQLLMVDKIVSQNYRLAGVITTVDALHAPSVIQWTPEMPQQIAVGDMLVATKLDLVDPGREVALEPRLRDINPAAPLIDARDLPALVGHMQTAAGKDASRGLFHRYPELNLTDRRHDVAVRSVCLTIDDPIPLEAFNAWLQTGVMAGGANFLRIKGVINIAEFDRPVVVQGVQHLFHEPYLLDRWTDDRRTRIVFIGRHVATEMLANTLKMFLNNSERMASASLNDILPGIRAIGRSELEAGRARDGTA